MKSPVRFTRVTSVHFHGESPARIADGIYDAELVKSVEEMVLWGQPETPPVLAEPRSCVLDFGQGVTTCVLGTLDEVVEKLEKARRS